MARGNTEVSSTLCNDIDESNDECDRDMSQEIYEIGNSLRGEQLPVPPLRRRPRPRRPHHPAVDLTPDRRLPPHPSDPKVEVVPVYLPCVCAYIVSKREDGLPQLLLRLLSSHVPITGRLATSLTLPLSMMHRGAISGGRRHRISCQMVFPCSAVLQDMQ
ncbi:uncharacterized protein [Triticum aestivum]|uniref:uncharacterized protein n=1 Tax=Triticum aestivum TaxID=4565 RepID=UPI001D011206|nr:uncharacterized protein LOC123174156 [Triticum aestivum]